MKNRQLEFEFWMPVKDYIGLYEVSNFGRVRSLNYMHTGKVKVLKCIKHKNDYLYVDLMKDGIKKRHSVHRLVWETFNNCEIPEGLVIDHLDGCKTNNCLNNLRCVTQKDNVNNPSTRQKYLEALKTVYSNPEWRRNHADGMRKRSQNQEWRRNHAEATRKACSKPVHQIDNVTGEIIKTWESIEEAKQKLNILHISCCCRGERKTAGGFKWRFVS